jgi:hypothetical protein
MLHLSVWDMSRIRDRMFACGAAHCAGPPSPPGAMRTKQVSRREGIPAYKLAMIDGFVVGPKEISQALCLIDAWPPSDDEGDELWKSWLDFLRLAVDCGGFIVE